MNPIFFNKSVECFHHLIGWQYHLQRYLWEGCGNTFQQLHALKVQPHLSSHQFPVPLTFVAWQPKNKHLKGRTGTRTLMKTTESATPTKCGYSHWHFDVCLQTTLVIKYLEKQHDSEIGTTVVKLWLKNRKAHSIMKRINRMWHTQTSHTDPSDKDARPVHWPALLTCFCVRPEMLKSSASLFESHITEMSCTHLSCSLC